MGIVIFAIALNILTASFLDRAAYGGEYIDQAYNLPGDNDAERNDDYRGYLASQGNWNLLDDSDLASFNDHGGDAGFTSGGLYNARVNITAPLIPSNSFDAQGLLAVKDGDTLVLSFRGTDGKDPAVESGQAFTGQGLAANYEAFKPLIDAAYQYVAVHPEITHVVVSGHSLGGGLADVFALVDAGRFRALRPGGLTIVSLGSSGVPPDLAIYQDGVSRTAAHIVDKVIGEILGVKITVPDIVGLNLPPDYISIANTGDRAHFPNDFPDVPEDIGLVPIVTLKDNLQFGGDLLFKVPNIDNADVIYYDISAHPLDFRGMGAQHNSALIWANLQGLVHDELFRFHKGQQLIAGITDYNHVPDYNGTDIALFAGYLELDNPDIINDRGDRSLVGSTTADYILGLDGNDRIDGKAGADLLSGGKGNDVILGGAGNDVISGGMGQDILASGLGRDRLVFTDTAQSVASHADIVRDFNVADDKIAVEAIDAQAHVDGNQSFKFIHSATFTAEGQVRAVQLSNGDTELRFNVSGTSGAEMEIILKNVDASTLTDLNFIP